MPYQCSIVAVSVLDGAADATDQTNEPIAFKLSHDNIIGIGQA